MSDKLDPVSGVSGFLDIVENGPAGAVRFIAGVALGPLGLVLSPGIVEAAGQALKPKRHDKDEDEGTEE